MRAAFPVLVLAAVSAVAGSGCGFRSVTREDRIAASIAASKMKDGTVLTGAQVDLLDQDATYECHREMRLGSHIPKLTCRPLRRLTREHEDTQRALVKMATSGQGGGGGSAGRGGSSGGKGDGD